MMSLEYRKKPVRLVLLGHLLILVGIGLIALPFANNFPTFSFAGFIFPDNTIDEKYFLSILPGLVCLKFGFHRAFSRRNVVIDSCNKMVTLQERWPGGIKEKTIFQLPFHSFRSISIGGLKQHKKNTYFYPVLLGIEDIVIPCGSNNKKDVVSEIQKISNYMKLQLDKKYCKVSRSNMLSG